METTEDLHFIFRLFIYEKGDHLYLASHEKTHEMAYALFQFSHA